ncbi:MAG: XdhC family protein [Pseudomonadales bacterium]|nr:XdhC family protein [Pseudomonadales bacterium]
MENADLQVLSRLTEWIGSGEKCWLCTVVKTWGSSPRPVGSLLCCNEAGQLAGSLSGGCIEDDLMEKLQQGALATDKPTVHIYGATAEEAERFNLPCGGQLHITIEPFIDKTNLDAMRHIVTRLNNRECVERRVDIANGDMIVEDRERFRNLEFIGNFQNTDAAGTTFLVHTYGPRYQLFLIGGSQVSMYLAEFAQKLDYQVLVCDPRENIIEQWPVEGTQLVSEMPDDAVRKYVDNFSAVIALTHDPRIDDMGLMEALKTDAFFVGAMGSTRTSAKRRERLLMLDLTEEEIARLHAPVGLPIGSKTPAEIAISILAELTAVRTEMKKDAAEPTPLKTATA